MWTDESANGRRKRFCDELAESLGGERGLETVRLLQAAGLLAPGARRAAPVPPDPGRPRPIGEWMAVERDGETVFAHPDGRILQPAAAGPRRRLCLIGESAAAGFFYAPRLTPALLLERQLARHAGPDAYEVVDLAYPGQTLDGLLQVTAAALQLHPDALIIYAGNNWLPKSPIPGEYADGELDTFQEHADVLSEEGIGGLRRLAERQLRRRARWALDSLAQLAAGAGARLLFVVPDSNLVDFEVLHPVFWLPGDGVARWYALYEQASDLLRQQSWEAAAAAARGMIELDGGACATSHRLLAGALLAQGRCSEAHGPLVDHLDASCWDEPFRRASAAPAPLREEILDVCRRQGIPCVDLAEVFVRWSGSRLTGRRLFLDHSHLSAEGMQVAMAAVAAALLGIPEESLPPQPEPAPPAVEALARLHAGLYNAHLNRAVDGEAAPIVHELFSSALGLFAGAGEAMRDYMEAMIVPGRAFLSAACRRNGESSCAFQGYAWLPWDLNVDLLEAMCRAHADHDGSAVEEEIDRLLIAHHAVGRQGVDAAAPRYRERDPKALSGYALRQPAPALFRALWPASTFYLVTGGGQDLRLELTLRLPAGSASPGRVAVELNGEPLGTVEACDRWRRQDLVVERRRWRAGVNRLRLRWPLPEAAGDRALDTAVRRLRLGQPADLHPVFGEVFSLLATLAEPAPAA